MDPYRNTRRQSGIDYPKPESDLAEWTSKIKAMQRQVDADEEAEQRRLEEEIAAARQARLRRTSRGARSTDGVELARAAEKLNLSGSPNDTSSYDRPKDTAERHGHQNEALRKIMGRNSVYVPENRRDGQPVSLASFIGGTATGPRLNKHSAQQDAHDPTQFNQPDTSAPHPIFGKGGIAMPGMVSKGNLGRGNGRSATPVQDNRKAISDLKAVASALGSASRTSEEAPKSSYLRKPDEERKKSASPTPQSIVGTETAERYRPSTSPTPASALKAQKSFDRGSRTYGTEDSERYRPSASPTPSSTLRSQKSFDRSNNRSYGTEESERYRPSPSLTPKSTLKAQKSFDRSTGSPSFSSNYSNQRTERSVSPQKTGGTFSTSIAAKSTPDLRTQKSWSRADDRPLSLQKTGDRDRANSNPKPTPQEPTRGSALSTTSSAWTQTPANTTSYLPTSQSKATASSRERTISSPSFLPKGPIAMQPTGKSTVVAPVSLAKPIQPEPRPPSTGPKISASPAPSPAFQKAAPPKEVTPSISRLQGRGFVQNMVKTSLSLESHSAPTSATSTPAEKARPTPIKKGSVLERWQPHLQKEPASPVSPSKPTLNPPSRKATVPEPQALSARTPPIAPKPAPSYLKPSNSKPSSTFQSEEPLTPRTATRMMDKVGPVGGPAGSATTMFVEKPLVDELGVKRPLSRGANTQGRPAESTSTHHNRPSELPAPSGKPLIHPTKDRARRPKRGSSGQPTRTVAAVLSDPTETLVEEPATPNIGQSVPLSTLVQPTRDDSKIGRLTEQWKDAGPIMPKAASSASTTFVSDGRKEPKQYSGIRHALPGMTKEASLPTTRSAAPKRTDSRERPTSTTSNPAHEYKLSPTSSPVQQPRIPSTGSRPTVMDVAQALTEHAAAQDDTSGVTTSVVSPTTPERPQVLEKTEPVRGPTPRQTTLSPGAAEKRKSSYDAFVTLPPLKEEATPAPSPANTFSRLEGRTAVLMEPISERHHEQERPENKVEEAKGSRPVTIEHDDQPLPPLNLSIMLNGSTRTTDSPLPADAKTVSVEVISIVGANGTTLAKDTSIFYESEVLSIIHRFKLASSGLVDTYVWGWLGKKAHFGEVEEKKLHELARRYGTMPVIVRQYAEPAHLVRILGGKLAVRQGTRAYWASDNTAMHIVRSVHGVIFLDELDLSIENLCSGFSYCLSALGTVYVWYGTGSVDAERKAALEYAEIIRGDARVVELTQGENDDDEMFWMLLGQEAFADADYWRWRRTSNIDIQPNVWRVDAGKKTHGITAVEYLSDEPNPCQSVYVVDCVWELFVMVGSDARGRRQDIRFGLEIAKAYAKRVAVERPYTPTVHVLVLPSQIPLDLRLHVRDLDEEHMNLGNVPDHMNLYSAMEAADQLSKTSWDPELLKDETMLPLGLDASIVARKA